MPDILEKTIAREVMEEVGLALTGRPGVGAAQQHTVQLGSRKNAEPSNSENARLNKRGN